MSLPRMSLHIGDYKKDTGHLRAAGHGAYLLLIMHYWATGGLPADDKQLAAVACMSDGEWKKWKPVIQPLFGSGWRHKRIDAELVEAQAKYVRRASAGQRGGNAAAQAKQNSSNATSNATSNAAAAAKQPITDNPNQQGSKPDARALDLRTRIVRAFESANSPNIPDTSRADLWLSQGFDPDICVAVITDIASKKPSISSLNYFDGAIREAHEKRNTTPIKPQEIPWDEHAARFARSGGLWPMALGPEPGYAGCRCPPEILVRNGIDPKTGETQRENVA